ncbi:GILT-like protein F37H8.5 [Toxocara canis]|uniref:GILT-like protein F37H8.5 n=1 Tax=Toxocara canis TaxID=6265 RepID=A0A0B2W5J9_TOXCA|nr:GILT-like protein F37H8.5 [Toxocara canis]
MPCKVETDPHFATETPETMRVIGLRLTFSATALIVAVATEFNCNTVPPSLWCESTKLATKCGFQPLCDKYIRETKNKRVKLALLYESLCNGCQNMITKTLYPIVYKDFGAYVDIELVPYGNAKIKNGTIECQHGDEECVINRFESCVIETITGINAPLPYIYCLEKQLEAGTEFQDAVNKCYRTLKIDKEIQNAVSICVVSGLGDRLQLEAAKRTEEIFPDKHDHVPWMLFNNVSLTRAQIIQDSLPSAICQWFNGDKMPPACEAENARSKKGIC